MFDSAKRSYNPLRRHSTLGIVGSTEFPMLSTAPNWVTTGPASDAACVQAR